MHLAPSGPTQGPAFEAGVAFYARPVRLRGVVAIVLLCLTLATMGATALLIGSIERRLVEDALQRRADQIARSIDLKLSTYHAALLTISESSALREEFDLERIERLAIRVGELFGGWFVITLGDEQLRQLMNTRTPEKGLPSPFPRADYPELMRAHDESLRLGRSVTSDAFVGRVANELIVSTVNAISIPDAETALLGFVVTLKDITDWLMEMELDQDEFAAIADGSRRVIARSQDNDDFLLAGLPDWYIAFSEGRDSGVAVGAPVNGGAPRLFAMYRMTVAPGWTLAVSRPLPSPLSVLYRSAWPALSGLLVLLLGASIAALVLDRSQAKAQATRSAFEVAERERLLGEVRAADARKARLMAVLAHDLRTPLIALLGVIDLLRAQPDDTPKDRMLKRLRDDGHDMLQLIDDVLELASLGAGEAKLRPEPFSLPDLLNLTAEVIRPLANENGTEVRVQADAMPKLKGDVLVLRRVLLNFATNAVKATRGGSILLSATHDAAGIDGHTVTCAVTDTGCGIAAEDIPRLFRDFGMLERDGPSADGTGLGLAISRRLAAAMGGEVGVESTPGQGSRFWLRLKLPDAVPAPIADDEVQKVPSIGLAGLRVLVVEDRPLIRQLTCDQLRRIGMVTTCAEDGDIAVALAEVEEFDLILMDLQMPRLDGDKAAAMIRTGGGLSAQARIIGLSAHRSPEIAIMMSDLALDACLQKPLDIGRLVGLLQGHSPPVQASASSEDFDVAKLDHLREIDNGVLLTRTLKAFSAEIEVARTELAKLVAARSFIKAARLVHRLVGVSDLLGFKLLSTELHIFEDLIGLENSEALVGGLERINSAMLKARTQIDRLAPEADR
jgi:signal transduction histidine kinase/DNA-binding response OmpR family regulator